MLRTASALTISLLAGIAVMAFAQAPGAPAITSKALVQAPLGETADPKVSVLSLSIPSGVTVPSHTHQGPVFAYILQGDIENQVDPDPPKVYHPGDFFFEPAMHVHRLLRNLSNTDPAKILVFQVGDAGKAKTLIQEPADVANRDARLIRLTVPPDASLPGAHKHPGPVFAYIVRGEIENQVDPDPPRVYRAGDVFYEPPLHAHRILRNRSQTEPAELVIFQIAEKGQPLAIGVEE